jgi:hypothetical protein
MSLWRFQNVERMGYVVKEYLGQWTERRHTLWTEQLEQMDKAASVRSAENRWYETLQKKEFKEASLSVMKEKAKEIRANCWTTTKFETVAVRLWKHGRTRQTRQPKIRRVTSEHLNLDQDTKEWILEQLKELVLREVLVSGDGERMEKFKDLVMLQSIEEDGCSHEEYRVYHVWWLAATKGVEFTRADLEWEDEECRWGSSWVNPEDLRRWVMEEIAHRTPEGQIPSRLRQARKHFEPTEEEKAKIMRSYFREPEDLKDSARR